MHQRSHRILRWMFALFFALAGLLATQPEAHAQSCPSGKYCFYVPPALKPGHSPPGGWDLLISSSFQTVSGTYKIGNAAAVPYSVTAGTPLRVILSATEGVVGTYESAEQRGIYVEADSDALNVALRRYVGNEQSAAVIKDHTRSLGTRFRLGGYALDGNGTDGPFDFISLYAPTGATVTVEAPPGISGNYWRGTSGRTVTLSLAAGETYVLRTRYLNVCGANIDGSLITSNNPISVSTGGRGWSNRAGAMCNSAGGCGDDGQDHIFPTDKLGTTYVINQYNTNSARRVSVVADQDTTEISLNGTVQTTIDAGEAYFFAPTGVTLIETTKPAYVYQNTGRSNSCELGLGFVPPLSFGTATTNTAAFRADGSGFVNLVLETSELASIRLDGNATIPNQTITPVPNNPQWSVVTFPVASGNHVLEAGGDFQLGLVTDTGPSGLFAYYNIFNLAGCGDGALDPAEGCDDGNNINGDGCSAQCRIELGSSCTSNNQCVPGATCDNSICVGCQADADCGDGNECTDDSCDGVRCQNTPTTQGGTCSSGVCDGSMTAPTCVTCIDDANGLNQDAGCPAGAPVCTPDGSGGFICVGCTADADCDDGNDCTTNTCNTGVCQSSSVSGGTTCNGGGGVCNGSATSPSCVICLDDVSGAGTDTGCSSAEPYCDRSGAMPTCVECITGSQCAGGEVCNVNNDCTVATLDITQPADMSTINTTTPTIRGTATAGEELTVVLTDSLGNTITTSTVTASGGMWSLNTTGLGEDTYTVTASLDANGGPITDTSTFTVDTSTPTVLVTTPADGTTTTDDTPAIAGTTDDAGATVDVVITDDQGNVVATVTPTVTMGGMFSFDAPALADGTYTVTATATDAAGNSSSDAVDVTVDATAPTVLLTAPMDGALTNDTTPTVAGSTSDPSDTVEIIITDDQGTIIETVTATVDAMGNYSVDASSLADGTYTATVTSRDPAGNEAMDSVTFTVDTMAPTVSVTAPSDGSTIGDETPTIEGSTSDATDTVEVVLTDDQGNVVETLTATVDAMGNFSVDTSMLGDGTYTATATSTDVAGNTAMATTTFTVDNSAPTLVVDAPTNGATIADDTPTISGNAGDDANTVEIIIRDEQGNVVETLAPTVDGMGNFSADASMLPEGTYTIEVTSTDPAGNTATEMVEFTIDTTAPTVMLTSPMDGATTATPPAEITGTTDTPMSEVTVVIRDANGDVVETLTGTTDANGDFSVAPSDLPDGDYTVEVTATDEAGNEGTDAASITIDTMAPEVTITSPTMGEEVDTGTPTLTGTGEPGSTVEVFIDGMKVGEATVGEDGTWSFTPDEGLTPGAHTVEARTTDAAGNEGSSGTVSITVAEPEQEAPLEVTSPTDGDDVTGPTTTVTGTGEPGSTVTITVNGEETTTTVGEDGTWSADVDVPSGDVAITVTDDRGQEVTRTVTVVEDFTEYQLTGGCACDQGAPSTPTSPALLMIGCIVLWWRRRR